MTQKPKRYVTKKIVELSDKLGMEIESVCNDMLKEGCVLKETITISITKTFGEVVLIFAEY